jgi:hypothetical protein
MRTFILILLGCALSLSGAEKAHDPLEGRSRLYSEPDPSSPGGIQGRILRPGKPIDQILATPPDEPRLVYKGTITGDDQQSFRFEGLPMRKYDLVVIYENALYEGIQLHRGRSTLSLDDQSKIRTQIENSEPYYPHKIIHRLEGQNGRGNYSRAICTFYQDRPSELLFNKHEGGYIRDDPRRAFKVVILKDVGAGWQIVRARDLYSKWVTPGTMNPPHNFRSKLSRIRVADSIKDLGDIDLNH